MWRDEVSKTSVPTAPAVRNSAANLLVPDDLLDSLGPNDGLQLNGRHLGTVRVAREHVLAALGVRAPPSPSVSVGSARQLGRAKVVLRLDRPSL